VRDPFAAARVAPRRDRLELDGDGFRPTPWADLDLVYHWRSYLADPQRYLRHVLSTD